MPNRNYTQTESSLFFKNDYNDTLVSDISTIFLDLKSKNFKSPEGYSDLKDYVYRAFYKRKNLYENTLKGLDFEEDYFGTFSNHASELSEGWVADFPVVDNAGRIVVNKNNYERKLILPGNFIKQNKAIDINAKSQKIQVGIPDSELSQDNYVHFYGENIGDELNESRNETRFYFNFNPILTKEGIDVFPVEFKTKFAEVFFKEFNSRRIPFHLKIADSRNKFYADNVVVYLERRYMVFMLDFIKENHVKFGHLLRSKVPMFTFNLFENIGGIGFAEGIETVFREESFGTKTSALVIRICKQITATDNDEIINQIDTLVKQEHRKNDCYLFLNVDSKFSYKSYDFGITPSVNQAHITENSPLDIAVKIGYSICKEAFWDNKKRCNWIVFSNGSSFKPMTLSYIDGLSGVLLFFSEIYKLTQITLFKRFGFGILNTIFDKVQQYDRELQIRGFHNGSGGTIYAIQKAIISFNLEQEFQQKLESEIINKIFQNKTFKNAPYDVYNGTSGTLWGLLLIKKMLGVNFKYDQEVEKLKNVLLQHNGLWKTDKYVNDYLETEHDYLVGLRHGVTGIAYVLGLYQALYGKNDCQIPIQEAIDFEQNKRRCNNIWLDDYRDEDGNEYDPSADWQTGIINVAYSQIAMNKLNLNYHFAENMSNIIRYLQNDNISSGYDVLTRRIDSGFLDFCVEYDTVFPEGMDGILKIIDPIIQEFKQGSISLNQVNEIPSNPFIHQGLVGMSGLGMSILRLHSRVAVESYILPS